MQNVKRPLIIVLLGSLLLPVCCVASERAYLAPGDEWPSDWQKIRYALGWSALYAVAIIGQYLYRLAQRRAKRKRQGGVTLQKPTPFSVIDQRVSGDEQKTED